jgi:hypothetical protein
MTYQTSFAGTTLTDREQEILQSLMKDEKKKKIL